MNQAEAVELFSLTVHYYSFIKQTPLEQKIAKRADWVDGTLLSIVVITICWFALFSPWTRHYINFWWTISISSILISILAGHYHPEWTLDIDIDKKNITAGLCLAVVLWIVCYFGTRWAASFYPEMKASLSHIRQINDDPVYLILAIPLCLLMGQAEEVFWRGYIQKVFSEKWNANVGFAITAILYPLMYAWSLNWVLIIGIFIMGLVWGGLCRYNPRWLTMVMISHAVLNAMIFMFFPTV